MALTKGVSGMSQSGGYLDKSLRDILNDTPVDDRSAEDIINDVRKSIEGL